MGHINQSNKDRRRILLLEDDPIIQLIHSEYLKDLDCSFDLAKTGKEAYELYQKNKYAVMLLDKNLPDMDSLDFCQMVRKRYSKNELPIFILTASGELAKKASLDAGCNEFFIKPIDKDVLNQAVKHWLDLCNPSFRDHSIFINTSKRSANHVDFNQANRPSNSYR